jgi:hypothetical protein
MTRDDARGESRGHLDLGDPRTAERFFIDAFAFIRRTLGPQWIARETDPKRRGGYLLLDGPDDEDNPDENHLRMDRIASLVFELQGAQRIRGFSVLLEELRHRQTYEAVAEMRAANHMIRSGQDAWFIDPNAKSGVSHDAFIVLNGIEVAVEVKVKLPKAIDEYRPRLIENSLKHARGQLPKSGPSLIYLQLASPWTDSPVVMQSINDTIEKWLTNTRRVNGVHIMAERTFKAPNGHMSMAKGTGFIPNWNARTPVPDIQDWLDYELGTLP